YSENLGAQIANLGRGFRRYHRVWSNWGGWRDCLPNLLLQKPIQRTEQSRRATPVVDAIFSRKKQTISSRRASQARVHTCTPSRCFTQDCSEQSCKLSMPV